MRKIYYSAGLGFLIIANVYVIMFFIKICHNETIGDFSPVLMMIFSFFMAWTFWGFGRRIKSREENTIKQLNETYQKLMSLYDDIKDSGENKDKLSIRMFVIGVHDFGGCVWDVVTGDYPKEKKSDAEQKMDELMKRVVEFM